MSDTQTVHEMMFRGRIAQDDSGMWHIYVWDEGSGSELVANSGRLDEIISDIGLPLKRAMIQQIMETRV